MRVLMTSWAWPSHYMPMAPVGWALRAAGHEVRVASQPALAPVITQSGQVAVPVGPDLDHVEVHRRVMRDVRLTAVPAAPPPGVSMSDWHPERRERVRRVFGVFAAYSEAMLDDLYEYARWWRPDLIVFDPTTFAGPVVAAALGVSSARLIHGVDVTYQARDVIAELVAPMAARLGVTDVKHLGDATIDPCPPSMQIPTDQRRIVTRHIPYNGPASLPPWLATPPRRSRICLTWGTSTTRLTGLSTFAPPMVIAATRDLDAELVVAITKTEVPALGDVPDGVRVAEHLPLDLVLPYCDAIVHQGGNGTLLTAAYHGVPQLALPQLPDQTFHSDCMAATGAGTVLRADEASEETIHSHLLDLLTRPDHRSAARRLRAEMRAAPSPAEVVDDLVALAGDRELVLTGGR